MFSFSLTWIINIPMTQTTQLNYDELTTIVKNFKDEGEDFMRLHANTRQRVHDLRTEWIGEGAEKFFEEMETELLPALARLFQALFFSQNTLLKIMKIIYEKDTETAGYFKIDFAHFNTSNIGSLSGILGNTPGTQKPPDDFGASKFNEALPEQGGGLSNTGAADSGQGAGNSQSQDQQETVKMPETQNTGVGSSGGVGGGTSSQGSMGDLKGMGSGLGAQTSAGLTGSGANLSAAGQGTPDHIYDGASGAEVSRGEAVPPSGSPNSGNQTAAGEQGTVAAGAAGIAGTAAVAGAVKTIRGRRKK